MSGRDNSSKISGSGDATYRVLASLALELNDQVERLMENHQEFRENEANKVYPLGQKIRDTLDRTKRGISAERLEEIRDKLD
ncbi:hypothetical protein TRVA0_053S00958 [Trichomonascus vanleenenianus]|uniref:uncharacterized protein n=1 Tax=Trichomonascus vanleenenianus TaxID=2268995 RepID=UPI003EC9E375